MNLANSTRCLIAALVLAFGCSKKESAGSASPPAESKAEQPKRAKPKAPRAKRPAPRKTPVSVYFNATETKPLTSRLTLTDKPAGSVVLIVADALNVRHLSSYGYERPTSPVIDSFAETGVRFNNHVSNSSWTRPSFTTIITGLPKAKHGVELRGGWHLKQAITTLAERFRRAGYRTAGYTGNPLVRKSWGFDQGFQVYEGPTTLGLKAFPRDSVIINHAIEWIEKQKDRPIFLQLFLTSSHPPYRPPQKPRRFLSSVPAGKIIEHPFKEYKKPLPKDDHARIVAAYDDEIAYMDAQIGRLMKALEANGRRKDTTIVFTADHGEVFGLHNCYLHAYHMWEPALRVPLIIQSPRIAEQGVLDDTPFTHEDIAPTLLALAGIPHDGTELKGVSILEHAGVENALSDRIRLSQYNAHGVRRQAVRQFGLKLVHHHKVPPETAERLDELHPSVKQADPRNLPSLAWDGERYELYDLVNDTDENHNLYAAKRETPAVKTLEAALTAHLKGEVQEGEISAELMEALKAVGYIVDDEK